MVTSLRRVIELSLSSHLSQGFMRHPFFLSPASATVCLSTEQTAQSASGSAPEGGSLGQRCPGLQLLPGGVTCRLLVWLKGNMIPSQGVGAERRKFGRKEMFMDLMTSWGVTGLIPRTRTGLFKVMLKKELSVLTGGLSFRWDPDVAAQSPWWGYSVSYPIPGWAIPVLPALDLISLHLWGCCASEHSTAPTTAHNLFEMKSTFLHHGFSGYIWLWWGLSVWLLKHQSFQ